MKGTSQTSMRGRLLLRAACALAVAAAGCGASSARREILRDNETLFHAIAARDVATLERVLAPDFRFEQAGQRGDRRAWLAGIAARAETVEWITNEELRLRVDGDHALLCGVQRAGVLVDGKRITDRGTFCDRWQKLDGHWLVTFAGP
jgi:hypothetical protein